MVATLTTAMSPASLRRSGPLPRLPPVCAQMSDSAELSYRELQRACKAAGLPAVGKARELRERLLAGAPPPPSRPEVLEGALLERCLEEEAVQLLDAAAKERVLGYVRALLRYNARTNVYARSSYDKLPFHVADSVTLGLMISEAATPSSSVLDLGSGSGLPSLLLAAVNPQMHVYALESKSRKTRFLAQAGAELRLPLYTPITANVHEFARVSFVDADFVTAKAFKPLPEVAPIAAACVGRRALLHVPVSEAQVRDISLAESQLLRRGRFVYYREAVVPARSLVKRRDFGGGGAGAAAVAH